MNPDFLTDEWRLVPPEELLARLEAEWSADPTDFFTGYGLPDPQQLTFYRLLDSLSWG
ncbi:hypothetical protein GCM10009789_10270 [Kribbella sancticallisti]|uniref:Uncharacterized protein n=1 Tax=Kribbella sancticallisti TaxID=460087 RepID=A0ABN2CHC9_9ACTN